jgi:flagellar assembly factor FliW
MEVWNMQVQTTRFGQITISENDLITFNEGILGFSELRKFVLLDDPGDEIFAWLQSCEKPAVAFPVLEPELFTHDYKVKLSKHDLESLQMIATEAYRMFTIVTIPADVTLMTANLKAPIIVNIKNRIAKQVVAQENDFPIKFPMFTELQKRVVQNPTADIKSHAAAWGVAVRLGDSGVTKSRTPETNL